MIPKLLFIPLAVVSGIVFYILVGANLLKQQSHPPIVSIGIVRDPEYGIIAIAQENDFFKKHNVNVGLVDFQLGREAIAALNEGSIDLATTYITPFTNQILSGKNLIILGTLANLSNNFVLVANKQSGINSLGDMTGKRIGVIRNTSSEYFLNQFLAFQGISKEEVILVDMKLEEAIESLRLGTIDAMSLWNPYVYQAKEVLDDNYIEFRSDFYHDATILVANAEFVQSQPQTVQSLVAGLSEAALFFEQDPTESISIVTKFSRYKNQVLISDMITTRVIEFSVRLDNRLNYILQENARLFIANGAYPQHTIDFKNYMASQQLSQVNPEAVTIY